MDYGKQNNMNVTSIKKDERSVAVNAIIINKEGQFLLGKRAAHKSGGGQWGLVGGTQAVGETMQETMARELNEEIGITVSPNNCVFNNFFQCIVSDKIHFDHFGFVITDWEGKVENKEPNKCDELRWFNRDEIPWDNFFVSKGNLVNYFDNVTYSTRTDFDYRNISTMDKQ